ncbi:tail fiber protein [Enterobacter bugandensis]|uniref:tail fiber protein n=1 Tax=Enterobacter bugandensis TaxID=881260 RepID=UPI0021AF155B|nr:tail fiber protein [Enterobacter bugandensis]
MSQTAITLAFEQWKASQAVTGEPVLLDEFVFANVPGLDASKPIDRNETLPPDAQIVHRQAVNRKGVVNENAVVHSAVLGADVGDFSFNWIGLINKASNTLAMIVHAPVQQKLKTKDGQQGNVLTRSFLMEFNGAQTETGINTPAETWQIDFTARMAGMDERQRLENIDLYGAAAFFGDGYLVGKNGAQYFVTPGVGYVRGLRSQLAAVQNITVTTKPVKVWLDVAWTGTLTSAWAVESKITVADALADYVQGGVQHYVFAVASIDANGNVTDLRPNGTLDDQAASDALKKHEQSRNHPDATTAAKGFTQLSSATNSDSEALAATPKAVKAAYDLADGKYTAQDATTAQKGIVQLSSATDSASESVAATPKAVKTAYDLANGKYTAQDATTAQKGIVQLSSATNSTSELLAATPKAVKVVSDDIKTLKSSLGDAAFRNVVEKSTGELIPVGYKGNFKSECNHEAIDFATYPFVVGESLFVDSRGCTNTPLFLTQDFYYINVVCATSPAQGGRVNRPLIQFVSYTNSTMIFAIREDDGSTIGWRYFRAVQFDADNQNVTLPGDVRARNGAIELSQSAIIIRGSGNKHLWFFNASGAEMGLVYASDDKVLHLRAGEGPSVNIQSNGNVVAPNYLEAKDDIHSGRNISSVGLIQAGRGLYDTPGVRTYSPNNEPPYPVTSVNGMQGTVSIDLSPYAQSAWVAANFLQGGIRLGSAGTADNGNNDGNYAYAPNGAFVTAVMQKTNYTAVQYRYVQYNINGNWYTAQVIS